MNHFGLDMHDCNYSLPRTTALSDIRALLLHTGMNEVKDVVVEIERTTRNKPFLGGYRHKQHGVEYHHASAQTMQKPRPPGGVELFCRDTQTVEEKHVDQQTFNDMATQMTKIGVYVSNVTDKLIVPGPYTTAETHRTNIWARVRIPIFFVLSDYHALIVRTDTFPRRLIGHTTCTGN